MRWLLVDVALTCLPCLRWPSDVTTSDGSRQCWNHSNGETRGDISVSLRMARSEDDGALALSVVISGSLQASLTCRWSCRRLASPRSPTATAFLRPPMTAKFGVEEL